MGQGKWKALKGGLTWYMGMITHVNRDESVDVMYDDGDVEHRVPLRFIQLLDKQPKASASGRGQKRKGCSKGQAESGASTKRRLPAAFTAADNENAVAEGRKDSAEGDVPSNVCGANGDGMAGGRGVDGKKPGANKGKAKAKNKTASGGGGKGNSSRQSKTRLIVQELPDAMHEKPLEECRRILEAVLGTKVAAPLLAAHSKSLFPLLVRAVEAQEGILVRVPRQAAPLDFHSIKTKLAESCQALEAASAVASSSGAHASEAVMFYSNAQQVREDIVRLVRLINDSWPVRQALRVSCGKMFEAFNDLFEARILPPYHLAIGAEMMAFEHGM